MTQAIETRYAGCKFRSRLEARWAVFFDHMGIGWEYEPQGFVINDRPYLPDFLLDCGTWIEVKGAEEQLDKTLMKDAALALPAMPCLVESGPRLMVLGPIPDPPRFDDLGWTGLDASLIDVSIPASRAIPAVMARLDEILATHPGTTPLFVELHDGVKDRFSGISAQVSSSPALIADLRALVGLNGIECVRQHRHGFSPYSKKRRPWVLYNHKPEPKWLTPVKDSECSISQARDAYVAARSARFEHGESGA